MKSKQIIIAVLALTSFAQLNCSDQKLECKKIGERTEELIRANDLEQLYASLSESAKSSTAKSEFDERANRMIAALQKADSTLGFVKVREGGVNPDGFSDLYYEFRSVGSDANKLDIEFSMDLRGKPKLFDVCVKPAVAPTVESEICITNALRKI